MADGFTYGGQTILSHPIFVETILPFVLVFAIVFAVLQKSQIFGKGKKQIDAIVSLVVGLLVISFAQATGIIVQLVPFLAVSVVILLVLMILLGSFREEGALKLHKGITIPLTVAVILAVVAAVLYTTGWSSTLYDWIFISEESNIFMNIVFIVIIIGAMVAVLVGGKKKAEKSE